LTIILICALIILIISKFFRLGLSFLRKQITRRSWANRLGCPPSHAWQN